MEENENIGGSAEQARKAVVLLAQEFTKVKPTLRAMVIDVDSMTAGFNRMSKEMQLSGNLAKEIEKTYKNSNTIIASIQTKLKETNATDAQRQMIKERIENLEENALEMASDMETAVSSLYKLEVARATGLTGIYASQAAELSLMVEKGLLTSEQYQNHIKDLKTQAQMQKHLDENLALNEEIAAQIVEIREETESWKKSFEKVNATARSIANDPKTLAFFAFNEGVKGLEKMHHTFHEMHEMGLSAGQAMEGTFKQMDVTSMDWWLGLSDTQGVMKGIVSEYGNVNALSKDTVSQLGKMATSFGISGEEAAQLNAALSQIPGETSESAANAMEHVGHMAKMQGIAPGKIMKDMAKNAGAMALYSKGGAEAFGKSAIELHKMGVEIGTAAKMADGLLDFENSINKQMEASVLLGKEINLDKAREAALNGDLETSTAEVLKNIGGAAEFEKMNVLQKKALAEAAGMTVEEMQKSIDAQEEQNKYFGEGSSLAMNAMGYMMQYGGAAAGFFKENGMLLMTSVQFMSQFGILQKLSNGLTAAGNFLMSNRYVAAAAHWAKEKAQWVAEKAHMLWKAAAEKMGFASKAAGATSKVAGGAADAGSKVLGKGADMASAATDKAAGAADKASKVPPGKGGIASTFKDVANGLKQFANPKVIIGALLGLPAAAIGLVAMLAAIPTILLLSIPGIGIGFKLNMKFIGQGLSSLGNAAANPMTWLGIALLAAFGASLIPLTFALSLLAPVIEAFGKVITAVFEGMAVLVGAIADAFVKMFQAFADNWQVLIPVGLGLGVLAMGMLSLGAAAWFSFPGLMLAAAGLALLIPGLTIVNEIAKENAFASLAEGFTAIAATGGGLLTVAGAMAGIGAGLGLIALAGLGALPVFGALMALAAVAPVLATLGSLFGGGGGEEKQGSDDKMDKVIQKLDQLIAVASKGGEVKMDGRKVGEVVRLALNTSNVR